MRSRAWPATILLAHVAMVAWAAVLHSPTFNEIGHVPAGMSHWQYGMFQLYRVNPPLPRMVATLPLLMCNVATDWQDYGTHDFSRDEIPMAIRFARANGPDTFRLFMIARWVCVPFSILGAVVCWRWAAELWGSVAGIVAIALWCFNPMILGHAPLVMPDVPAAATGVAAAHAFWKWLRAPSWLRAIACGGILGVALLCKTTLLIFLILWPLIWMLSRPSGKLWIGQGAMLATILLLALYVVNCGYAFTQSFDSLGSFQFQSRMLVGNPHDEAPVLGNRWSDTWLAA